jgi:hypothetical protein
MIRCVVDDDTTDAVVDNGGIDGDTFIGVDDNVGV